MASSRGPISNFYVDIHSANPLNGLHFKGKHLKEQTSKKDVLTGGSEDFQTCISALDPNPAHCTALRNTSWTIIALVNSRSRFQADTCPTPSPAMAAILSCVAALLLADLSSQSPVITKEKTVQDVLFPAHLTYEPCRLPPELDTWGTVAFLEDCNSLGRSGTHICLHVRRVFS